MADYSRHKIKTLLKMRDRAEQKYNDLTMQPVGNWGDGMRLSRLPSTAAWERARALLSEIDAEIERRKGT